MSIQNHYITVKAAEVPKHSSEIFVTGQTATTDTGDDGDIGAGTGSDFFTLSGLNGNGTAHRFTMKDLTALTSANNYNDATIGTTGIIVDWKTWDRVNDKVLCWYVGRTGTTADTWAIKIAEAIIAPSVETTYTTGWKMPNINELISMMEWAGNGSNLAILRFLHFYDNSTIDFWSSSDASNSASNVSRITNNNTITSVVKTGSANSYQCRYYTLTELGL